MLKATASEASRGKKFVVTIAMITALNYTALLETGLKDYGLRRKPVAEGMFYYFHAQRCRDIERYQCISHYHHYCKVVT